MGTITIFIAFSSSFSSSEEEKELLIKDIILMCQFLFNKRKGKETEIMSFYQENQESYLPFCFYLKKTKRILGDLEHILS